ncbi:MAG: hypothetical protein ACR2IJ_06525 [Fluviibacter sp.]
MIDEEKSKGKELLEYFRLNGFDSYGADISGEEVRYVLGLVIPIVGTKEDFDKVTLTELAAIGYVRDTLLNEGKYLACHRGHYRILLPSENAKQVMSYMDSADKKLKKGLKLHRNTPSASQDLKVGDDLNVRIHMRQEALKKSTVYGKPTRLC